MLLGLLSCGSEHRPWGAAHLTRSANAVICRSKYSSQEVFEGSIGRTNPTSNTGHSMSALQHRSTSTVLYVLSRQELNGTRLPAAQMG